MTTKNDAQLTREIAKMLAPKKGEYTKLATATSIPLIQQYINEFAYSTSYRVDPATLSITNAVSPPPEKWFVMPHRGGFLFGRRN